ncbi:MAG: acetate--CoA ligase alpha subunit [bacterium]
MSLKNFFEPNSIAIVGASNTPEKVGYEILKNLIKNGFTGHIYPINPKADEILNLKCYSSLLQIENKIDLVVIIVPNVKVASVLEECGQKKINSVIIISAGFKESSCQGAELEKQIGKIAEKHNIKIVGPNCLGLINPYHNLDASFSANVTFKGKIAFMSQSGALCTAILDIAEEKKIGFSKFVSLGNKLNLDEVDFLKDWTEDSQTDVILCYLEGIKRGNEFIKEVTKTSLTKPVIIVKSGTTSSGAKAASSHTGTLTGSDQVYEAVFKQCGIIRANSFDELFDYALGFDMQNIPDGKRVAIITNAGGPGIMATDACEKAGLKITSFNKETISILQKHLPPAANFYNPVDVLGDAKSNLYQIAIKTVLNDSNVDLLLVLLTPQAMTDIEEIAKTIVEISNTFSKPIFTCFMGGKRVKPALEILQKGGIPNYSAPERAVKVIVAMDNYKNWIDKTKSHQTSIPSFSVNKEKISQLFAKKRKEGILNIGEVEAKEVFSAYNIPFPVNKLALNSDEAIEMANSIGYPVVMKIVSSNILHKSDIGGVKVNLKTPEEIKNAFDEMTIRTKRFMPEAEILGVDIQEYIADGKEIIIGMTRDSQFGPLIMFGMGGIYVEILKDISFRIAPLTERDAMEMIQETKSYFLLSGARGQKAVNIQSIVDCLLKVSQLSLDFPEILELDINPLKVSDKLYALDARLTIQGE